jgi:hypothetical protein
MNTKQKLIADITNNILQLIEEMEEIDYSDLTACIEAQIIKAVNYQE